MTTEDTEVETGLVPTMGGAMEVSPEMAAELESLKQGAEELGGTLLDQLAVYGADHGRWKVGETKKDVVVGIFLFGYNAMRTFWPPAEEVGGELPHCWSLGGEDAVPAETAIDPQGEACEGCKWDEFKTAHQGKGKACKTKRADFFVELNPDKLEKDKDGLIVVSGDAVIGIAMLRASSTARETRQSIAQWAKDLRQESNGVPQLVVTEWGFVDTKNSGGTAFSAATLKCLGRYSIDRPGLEEVVKMAKDLREGGGEEIIVTLSGSAKDEED